jgi:ABC transporter substrate binding protein
VGQKSVAPKILGGNILLLQGKNILGLNPILCHSTKVFGISIRLEYFKARHTRIYVFVVAFDPVKAGLVSSLNRPENNITGVTFISASLGAKRLELVRELISNGGTIAVVTHPSSPDAWEELHDLHAAANSKGQQLIVLTASTDGELEGAFRSISERSAAAPCCGGPSLFSKQ